MITWPLDIATSTGIFDKIIVSTDDGEIAEIARQHGAETPFVRPTALSDDVTGTTEVVAHAVQSMLDAGMRPTSVCCLYPTAPFVSPRDLLEGCARLLNGGWDFVFTATDFASAIFRAFQQTEVGGVEMFWPEKFLARSQDLPRALHDAGQFYWGAPDAWLAKTPLFGPRSSPLIIPRWRVQDIDTPDDWRRAEALFEALGGSEAL